MAKNNTPENVTREDIKTVSVSQATLQADAASLAAEITRLRAENERLRAQRTQRGSKALSFKVSEKGGVSVYGLGRFPVTLYAQQWRKLFDTSAEILAFLAENQGMLATEEDLEQAREIRHEVQKRMAKHIAARPNMTAREKVQLEEQIRSQVVADRDALIPS